MWLQREDRLDEVEAAAAERLLLRVHGGDQHNSTGLDGEVSDGRPERARIERRLRSRETFSLRPDGEGGDRVEHLQVEIAIGKGAGAAGSDATQVDEDLEVVALAHGVEELGDKDEDAPDVDLLLDDVLVHEHVLLDTLVDRLLHRVLELHQRCTSARKAKATGSEQRHRAVDNRHVGKLEEVEDVAEDACGQACAGAVGVDELAEKEQRPARQRVVGRLVEVPRKAEERATVARDLLRVLRRRHLLHVLHQQRVELQQRAQQVGEQRRVFGGDRGEVAEDVRLQEGGRNGRRLLDARTVHAT